MTANTWTATRPRFSTRCAQCGDVLFAPVWSEFVKERCVRHLWNCDACGYAYETMVYFPAQAAVQRVTDHERAIDDAA